MGNLVVFYGKTKDILKIVSNYKNDYKADIYEIETVKNVTFFQKLSNTYITIKRCNINLKEYDNIILVSPLWFNKIPSPVIRFLEQSTGNINKITYVLYNKNKKDQVQEFDKMDKILNLKRYKSYFVRVNKDSIYVRVYQ